MSSYGALVVACMALISMPVAAEDSVLFMDEPGDGPAFGSVDLLDGLLHWGDGRPDLVVSFSPRTLGEGEVEVTWEAEDWFGNLVGRFGVRHGMADNNYLIIKGEGATAETIVAASGSRSGTDPVLVTFQDLPFETDFVGIAIHDIRATSTTSTVVPGDSAEGVAEIRFPSALRYGLDIEAPQGLPLDGSLRATSASSIGDLLELDEVYVEMVNESLTWTGVFPPLEPADFAACEQWLGSVYAQDARPEGGPDSEHYWDSLVQINWAVDYRGDVATPSRVDVHIDPRADNHSPNVTIDVGSDGLVQATLEQGWWKSSAAIEDLRIRFETTCFSDGARFETKFSRDVEGNSFNFPAPGIAVLALGLVIVAHIRRK